MAELGKKLYGGVEGGASHTTFLLVSAEGEILSTSEGKGTNQYLIGIDACLEIISTLVKQGLKDAGFESSMTLHGLGLSLSGGDDETVQDAIQVKVKADYPGLALHLSVGSDTMSALAAAFPGGGVVMIAGTGSNCELINPDGSRSRCEGWGHMIGDEASAAWISLRAIKTFFDHEDGCILSPHSIDVVKQTVFTYFEIDHRNGLLPHLYQDFNKAKFSGLCKELSKACVATKDALCASLFRDAGVMVARHLKGIAAKINADLLTCPGGLPVLAQGSVFKSWPLMEVGFVAEMTSNLSTTHITEVTLSQLQVPAGLGAAALGAREAGDDLPFTYSSHSKVMCHTKFKKE